MRTMSSCTRQRDRVRVEVPRRGYWMRCVDLDESLSGYQVTRLGHSLQLGHSRLARWRRYRLVGRRLLLHDVGDICAPYSHDAYAAAVLRPFVREQCAGCVGKHGDFQKSLRPPCRRQSGMPATRYKGHAYFGDCAAFGERWDQNSFDPD